MTVTVAVMGRVATEVTAVLGRRAGGTGWRRLAGRRRRS